MFTDLLREIDDLADEYLNNVKSLTPEEKTNKMNIIEQKFREVSEYSDSKVALAGATYELVDKQIRKLDSDLARFESDLKEKNQSPEGSQVVDKNGKRRRKKNHESDVEDSTKKRSKKKGSTSLQFVSFLI